MSGGLYSISLPVLDAQNSQLLFRLKTWKCTRSKRSKGKTARQKILDSNHWNHQASRTVLDQLLTETDPNPKQTSADLSLFISPCNKLSSFCGWRTRNYALSSVSANTKSKQTNFIKISFNEIKNRDYFWRYLQPQEHVSWRQKIFRQIAELSKSYSFGAKRNLETREIAAVQILIQF